jgi:hypothetical protein
LAALSPTAASLFTRDIKQWPDKTNTFPELEYKGKEKGRVVSFNR